MICPNCHAETEDGAYCTVCGSPLKNFRICKVCNALNDPDSTFCEFCGAIMEPVVQEKAKIDPDKKKKEPFNPGSFKNLFKSKKFLIITVVVLVGGLAGYFLLFGNSQDGEKSLGFEFSENNNSDDLESQLSGEYSGEYMAVTEVEVTDGFESKNIVTTLNPGQTVLITGSKVSSSDNHVWGSDQDGNWYEIYDGENIYLYPANELKYDSHVEDKDYKLTSDMYIYEIPANVYQPLTYLSYQEQPVVRILDIAERDNETWGRVGKNRWICIKDAQEEYLRLETDDKESTQENKTVEKVNGYSNGNYTLNYNMNVRDEPGYDASTVAFLKEGDIVKIVNLKAVNEKNSTWGEIDFKGSGKWICIKDDTYTYLTRK